MAVIQWPRRWPAIGGGTGLIPSAAVQINWADPLTHTLSAYIPLAERNPTLAPRELLHQQAATTFSGGSFVATTGYLESTATGGSVRWTNAAAPWLTPVSAVKPFSSSCWVLFTTVPTDGGVMGQWSGGAGWMIYCDGTNFRNYLNATHVSGSITVAANTWYHLVYIYDGNNTAYTYVNGVLDATNAIGSLGATADFELYNYGNGAGVGIKGRLESVAFWNQRLLSAADASALYQHRYRLVMPQQPPSAMLKGFSAAVAPADTLEYFFHQADRRLTNPSNVGY